MATHEGEAHSSLAGLDQRLNQWLSDLDVIKSGHVTIVAGLQVAKQLGASWKIEAKEHEQKVKEPREEEQKCAKYQFVQDRKNVWISLFREICVCVCVHARANVPRYTKYTQHKRTQKRVIFIVGVLCISITTMYLSLAKSRARGGDVPQASSPSI